MTGNALQPEWWSATSTWRLLQCPKSATPSLTPEKPAATSVDNAGTLTHLALQAWIEARGWAQSDPAGSLIGMFDEAASTRGVDATRLAGATVARARLKARAPDLAGLVYGATDVRSEYSIRDDAQHLFGILDVVVLGGKGIFIDLKTGGHASTSAWSAMKHQMTFYAHLFRVAFGDLPEGVVIFDLMRGPSEFEVTSLAVDLLIEQILGARQSDVTIARPQPDVCRFCPKRIGCQPHWEAMREWDHPDAIEGVVEKVERSTSGLAALQIDGEWLTGIPERSLLTSDLVGRSVRVVRLRRTSVGGLHEWIFSEDSRFSVVRRSVDAAEA